MVSMAKTWVKENGNLKTLGVMATFLAVIVNLIIQITSDAAQEVNDLKGEYEVECTISAKERADNRQEIAVLKSQYDFIKEQLADIKEAVKQ